jgi:hypothetical protein
MDDKKGIVLAYRENNFYDRVIPRIMEAVSSWGHPVDVVVIPQCRDSGTTLKEYEEECRNTLKKEIPRFVDRLALTDDTVRDLLTEILGEREPSISFLKSEFEPDRSATQRKTQGYLETLFNYSLSALRAASGSGPRCSAGGYDDIHIAAFRNGLAQLIQTIGKKKTIEKVYIDPTKMHEHTPFRFMKECQSYQRVGNYLELDLIGVEKIVSEIKEAVEQAGIPSGQIYGVVPDRFKHEWHHFPKLSLTKDSLQSVLNESSLLIGDRHQYRLLWETTYRRRHGELIRLPLAQAYDDAVCYGLIYKSFTMEDALEEQIGQLKKDLEREV